VLIGAAHPWPFGSYKVALSFERSLGLATPSRLCDFDGLYDPDWGSDGDFNNPHGGDWLDFG
jgi:hypothetical protein